MWQCPCDDRSFVVTGRVALGPLFAFHSNRNHLGACLVCGRLRAICPGLTIAYTVSQNQSAVVGPGFTVVDCAGSVTNNCDAAITFQLTGVLHNFESVSRDHFISRRKDRSNRFGDCHAAALRPVPALSWQCRNCSRLSMQCRVLFSSKMMPPHMWSQP